VPIVAETSALESTVRTLAGFTGERAPVTTVYLDVDGRRHPRHIEVERRLDQLVRKARASANGTAAHGSVAQDLQRIVDWVRSGFDRSRTRGLVMVSCTAHQLFEVIELPVPVRDRIVVNHAPAIGQLESVIHDHEPIGVLLADRQRARMLVFALGELTEHSERFDQMAHGDPGHHDRGDLAPAQEAATHAHLRNAADVAWRHFQERPFVHLAVGGPDAVANELAGLLHPYLRERLVGRVNVAVGAGPGEIREAAVAIEHLVDRRREAEVVDRLRREVASGRRGVTGLAATLQAINDRRVDRLLVSDGYREEGWRCPATGVLAAVGPISPATGERMERVDDVVEDAIDAAVNQGCRVDICIGNADLDVLGRIGALLRY
jgi:peptide subunit release factor 1 (eRF1)